MRAGVDACVAGPSSRDARVCTSGHAASSSPHLATCASYVLSPVRAHVLCARRVPLKSPAEALRRRVSVWFCGCASHCLVGEIQIGVLRYCDSARVNVSGCAATDLLSLAKVVSLPRVRGRKYCEIERQRVRECLCLSLCEIYPIVGERSFRCVM